MIPKTERSRQGCFTMALALFALFWLPLHPAQAWFLNPAERDFAVERMHRDSGGQDYQARGITRQDIRDTLKDWKLCKLLTLAQHICLTNFRVHLADQHFCRHSAEWVHRLPASHCSTTRVQVVPRQSLFRSDLCGRRRRPLDDYLLIGSLQRTNEALDGRCHHRRDWSGTRRGLDQSTRALCRLVHHADRQFCHLTSDDFVVDAKYPQPGPSGDGLGDQ